MPLYIGLMSVGLRFYLGGRAGPRRSVLPPGREDTFQSWGVQDAQRTDEGNPVLPVHLGVIV